MVKGMTISDAAHKWVNEFNAIPQSMIERLMRDRYEEWEELTMPHVGSRVHVFDLPDDLEIVNDDPLPMWGTMWSFGDSCDNYWLENAGGVKVMSECGFRIYRHEEWGHFFGIDGAGYDFYSEHWIPLYRMRGLQWHDPDTEVKKK